MTLTLEQLIVQAREALAAATVTYRARQDALVALRAADDLSVEAVESARAERDAADSDVQARQAALDELLAEQARDAEIAALQAQTREAAPRPPVGGARVTSEPEVYRKGGAASYFRDLTRATLAHDRGAVERLARNDQQVRALTTTDGAGGEFVPPLWMIQDFINLARAGRVVADQVRGLTLPGGTDTISLPRLATGTAVAEQSTQNTAVQNTDATTSSISASVTTIAGQQVISQQLVDQSQVNIDEVLLADLAADYATKADVFVINNNAAGKYGLLNVSGITAVTYTDASPTVGELYAKLADSVQQVHTNRLMPPTKIFMHPRRWAWFLAALDTQNRPLITPDSMNSIAASGGVVSEGRVGVIQGLPVYVDPNIPTNLGAGTNEDRIIVLRSDDVLFYEATPKAEVFRETYANQLSILLRFYNYVAVQGGRYPKAISVIAGTGLAAPTF